MILPWLFRPQCAACQVLVDEHAPLCSPCAGTLLEATDATPPWGIDHIAAPWRFGGQLASAIRRLKFTGATHVARTLAPLWAPVLATAARESDGLIVPVPLHWRRRLQRGFDQSWLLAIHACSAAKLPAPSTVLRRTRRAAAQSTLSAAQRAANLHGAFAVRDERAIRGRTIILVDDVVTTGATMAAAATPLLEAGASRVLGVALARTQ